MRETFGPSADALSAETKNLAALGKPQARSWTLVLIRGATADTLRWKPHGWAAVGHAAVTLIRCPPGGRVGAGLRPPGWSVGAGSGGATSRNGVTQRAGAD